jgi:hypothetical protein
MSDLKARPSFGGRLNVNEYYDAVSSVISVLRPVATLRVIAAHLNAASFHTPSGKPWTKERVATYIHNTTVRSN